MDDCALTTIIMTPNQFKEYVPVPADFDTVFPEARIQEIAAAFREGFAAIERRPKPEDDKEKDAAGMMKPLERDVTKLWVEITERFNLFPGYFFHSSETTPDVGDSTRLRIDASLISNDDQDDVVDKRSNWPIIRLAIELKPGGTGYDAFEKRQDRPAETETISRRKVRGQLMSYAKHTFMYQHRTKLFQMLLNGKEYRAMRWDRSGVIVTDAVNYVDELAGTRLLLEFLYGFSQLSDAAQGLDHTAVRVKHGSCGWMRMNALSFYNGDVDHTERSGVTSDEFPANFAFPEGTLNAPVSPLFENCLLHCDPCAPCNPSTDHHSSILCPDPLPVWKHMRDLFRNSLDANWPRYQLMVGGRKYLVGKPIFEATGMVSRATRGYIALEWSTQRFVFLKDAWRPFYVGVDKEGDVLSELNKANVQDVPTLIAHEDVREADGTEQETETSRYAPHASQDLRKKVTRPGRSTSTLPRTLAPLPSKKSKPNTSSATPAAGPSRVNDARSTPASTSRASQSATSKQSADGPASRGVKRSAKDVQNEEQEQDGSGLRHLSHYRIIVAEVCLPSTAFTSARQWVRIVLHCIQAHQGAYELCGIIHRDISVGNILIYPKYIPGNDGGVGMIFWRGTLCDWELAKKLIVNTARQPERTGTWQFMSLRCLRDPTLPVLLPDELESFLHALLYNAIRFVLHNFDDVDGFVNAYFDDTVVKHNSQQSAPHAKTTAMTTGELALDEDILLFITKIRDEESDDIDNSDDSDNDVDNHPLNALLDALLERFRARYDVLRWEAKKNSKKDVVKKREADGGATATSSAVPSMPPVSHNSNRMEVDMETLASELQHGRSPSVTRAPSKQPAAKKVRKPVAAPPPEVIEFSKSLDTHHAVVAIFQDHMGSSEYVWPTNDTVGYDRLEGYRIPRAPRTGGKPAKKIRTAPVNKVGKRSNGQPTNGDVGGAGGKRGRNGGRAAPKTVTGSEKR
ncbi:hypothetical protein C8Q80DRAFT_1357572 [Daedaleopsis nitida]|nr:hypothetical protein C8Q80DRAFT_1357572 [Daedaleopsis nitida]